MRIFSQIPNTHSNYLLNELIRQYQNHDKLIIAYDFDNTVYEYSCSSCSDVQSVLRMAKDVLNPYFIVYTCNSNVDKIEKYLNKYNIPYDTINENYPNIPDDMKAGKLYYNILLDDKAGLKQATDALKELIYLVENDVIRKD